MQVSKDPEPDYPTTFEISTVSNRNPPTKYYLKLLIYILQVISEDLTDNSFDDCTVKVLRYK